MQSFDRFFFIPSVLLLTTISAHAARVDMTDPRRALGTEDDVRIDAQLRQAEISSSSPISVTYQIQNLSSSSIAVADRVSEVDYDSDTGTVVFSIGAEVPDGESMPHLTVIHSGEKRVFSIGGNMRVAIPTLRTPWSAVPRYVQIRVIVMRDLKPFAKLIEEQASAAAPAPLPADLFDRWVEASDSLFLNPIPVHWTSSPSRGSELGLDAGGL